MFLALGMDFVSGLLSFPRYLELTNKEGGEGFLVGVYFLVSYDKYWRKAALSHEEFRWLFYFEPYVGGFYNLLRVESSYKDLNICGLLRFNECVSVTLTYSRLETGGEAFHFFSNLVWSALARS